MTSPSATSLAAISARPPSAKATAASRRLLASVDSTPMMSSSESSRCTLPATSALVMAVSTIRSVEARTSSRDLIAAVRSARRRSFRALMAPLWQPCRVPSPEFPRRSLGLTLGTGVGAGLALASYAAWEARQYTLREVTVPVLPPGHQPLRVLHLSDIHMAPDQHAKQQWLRSLADLAPDLVIDTGDNLGHQLSVPV